uniref:Vitamin K-dependent protein C n=1 Tax=Pygocentrus nattereri TaxID=42514 RepID=A0AAR2KF12_PYGNA
MSYHGLCLLLLLPLVCSELMGWVHSPDYPLAYPNHHSMNWSECAPAGLSVSLTFIHLDLENSTLCEHDVLMVSYLVFHLNMSLCGSMSFEELQSSVNPHLHSTSGGCLSIHFRSDGSLSLVHTGFNALYQKRGNTKKESMSTWVFNKANWCTNLNMVLQGFFIKENGQHFIVRSIIYGISMTVFVCLCVSVCGHHRLPFGRIYGGKIARLGSFPWQVLLLPSGHKAGAFIIGEKWIMTAAHNLIFDSPLSPENFVALNLSSIHIHPHYKNIDGSNFDNDIALIKLSTPITFHANVSPVCLPPEGVEMEVRSGWVSGFGLTEFHVESDVLLYVQLPIVADGTCRNSFAKKREKESWIPHLTDNMFCAGFKEGGNDSCKGDSGSAFVVKKGDVHWAMGIVSWGLDCGRAGVYGVYTRVSRYLDWINKVMSENE